MIILQKMFQVKLNLNLEHNNYKIYTNEFDEVAKAENLESAEEILKLRKI